MTTRNCAFDLTSRLDLISSQENGSSIVYDDDVPIDHIVCRENCCCDRISRYALVFLVSRHHQHITTVKKIPEAITYVIMETSLGRFTCYTHEDRNFVHFDEDTYSSLDVPLIPNQNIDEILLGARGYYLINDTAQNKNFVWHRSNDPLEFLASGNFFGIPDAVIYMPEAILRKWKRLERFSWALHDAMNSVLKDIHKPASFAIALQNLPDDSSSRVKCDIPMSTMAERLAACVYLLRVLSRKKLIEMDFDHFHIFARMNMGDLTEAHQHFRSPDVEPRKLFETSQDRFMRLFRKYRRAEHSGRNFTDAILRDGLLGLLRSNRDNVSLVVFQGFLATVARWNCCRVLSRAREAPEEWIKFVLANDDDIYIG